MSNSYEKQLTFGDFKGICQVGSGHGLSLSYAHDGYGFMTYKGEIRSMNPPVPFFNPATNTNVVPYGIYQNGFAMATLYRRFHRVDDVVVGSKAKYVVFINNDGYVWYKQARFDEDDENDSPTGGWMCANTGAPLIDSEGAVLSGKPCCVSYEINFAPPVTLTSAILTEITGGTKYYYFDHASYQYKDVFVTDGKAYYKDKDENEKELTIDANTVRMGYDAPVDALFIAHPDFGLACLYTSLESDVLTLVKVPVQPKDTSNEIRFGSIELYNDRLWGTCIETDPDKLMYSAPKDPFNWDQFDASPADGAGDIQQPNFNGDRFMTLKQFGTSLLAIKTNGIWRITGTNPSNYAFAQQYGNQEMIPNTAAVYGSSLYIMGEEDILRYNGYEIAPVCEGYISRITSAPEGYTWFESYHFDDFAVMDRHIYCVYLRHNTYQLNVMDNSMCDVLVEFNTMTGEINVRQTSAVDLRTSESGTMQLLCGTCDETNAMFMTADGEVVTRRRYDASSELTALPFYYESGYQNLSASNVIKGGFDIYLRVERDRAESEAVIDEEMTVDGVKYTTAETVKEKQYIGLKGESANCYPYDLSKDPLNFKKSAFEGKDCIVLVRGGGWVKIKLGNSTVPYIISEDDVVVLQTDGLLNPPLTMKMNVGIRTEKKLKSKLVTLTNGKPKRVHINANGRYFRLELSADAQISPWRILGNITANMELDYD